MLHVLARIVVHQRAAQVGKLFVGIAERITFRKLLQRIIRQCGFKVLQRNGAFKAQLGGGALECGNTDGVVEHVVEEAKMRGLGRDFQTRLEKPQVVAFPGPEHHAMLAQGYWFGVTISRGVSYGEEAHL